jgi:periplasmic copper chaperone A
MKLHFLLSAALMGLSLAGASAQAQNIQIKDAWVRSTVPGQKGSGAFMKITAKEGARLMGVSSPIAGVAEVHEMKMEGDVMKMRAVPVLDIPAGGTVELKPGGYHLMLMDLKQALPVGGTVPVTLMFKDEKGAESRVEVKLPVAAAVPAQKAHAQ